jgi:hypothetical protein
MGLSEIASLAGTARLRSVRVCWICWKEVILPRPREGNSPYASGVSVCISVSSMGLRVTMLLPLEII